MTESLKSMMREQASSVDFRPSDLRVIRSAGDRRIRRRRVGSMLAGTVAIALISGTVVMLGRADRPTVVSAWPADAVTWAVGSTIHVGHQTVEVGHEVRAYVRTGAGFAVIDVADDVHSVTAGGVQKIGHMAAAPRPESDAGDDQPRLVADQRGALVGWIGEDTPGSLTIDIFDQATGQRRSRAVPPETRSSDDVVFHAIDGRKGYWRTPSGTFEVDLDTLTERLLVSRADQWARGFELYTVQNGVLSFRRDEAIYAGRSVDQAEGMISYGKERLTMLEMPSLLSPSGAWLALGVTELEQVGERDFRDSKTTAEVFDTASGKNITLGAAAGVPANTMAAIPVIWLDEITLQVVEIIADRAWGDHPTSVRATVFRCTVPDGSCAPAADLGIIKNSPKALVLPDGRANGR